MVGNAGPARRDVFHVAKKLGADETAALQGGRAMNARPPQRRRDG
jgi:hypothetical protein